MDNNPYWKKIDLLAQHAYKQEGSEVTSITGNPLGEPVRIMYAVELMDAVVNVISRMDAGRLID